MSSSITSETKKLEIDIELIDELRPLLKTHAYNICGTVEEAEDVVQDVFLKFMEVDHQTVYDFKSYLIRMVVNRSINQKKLLKKRLTTYPGEWLPEPVATEKADAGINRKELLSYSLMVLLEKLNARQRAVFILKEAFDYSHDEISSVLGITTDLSRQLLSRAKRQLGTHQRLHNRSIPASFLNQFLQVIQAGDTKQLETLLTEDIRAVSDGGGKAIAALKIVFGKKSVGALLTGLYKKFSSYYDVREEIINHERALLYYSGNKLATCLTFSYTENGISSVYIVRNPDKLNIVK